MSKVVIVGGGASGLLVAVNLLRKSQSIDVAIVEPNARLGRGVAYSTADADHLLNVPAGRMSGLVEEPRSLCDWAGVDENYFIPRKEYGNYLDFLLNREIQGPSSKRFEHIHSKVLEIQTAQGSHSLWLENGQEIKCDSLVLALGNSESIVPDCFEGLPKNSQIVRDVWREGLSINYENVAVIGTGLTFYDIALSILRERPSSVIHGISRNGLLPEPHLRDRMPALPVPKEAILSAQSIRDYLTAAGDKWREAQDGIRHDLQEIWSAFPDSEKEAFITKHFRWWNSLRHRSAPEIDKQIKSAIATGKIIIHKGEVQGIQWDGEKVAVSFSNLARLEIEQVINCCGNDFVATHPLIESLVEQGVLARGPLGFGVACDRRSLRLKDSQGNVHKSIFGIGPILVGELLETTAIPEIKVEAELIARELLRP